jgi:transposase
MTERAFKRGACREQSSFLPARIEDYVGADNPVRAIEAYVSALDLSALGFRHAARGSGAGQPPFDPADLLKLYLYGYLNQVRSSRRLEREAGRNVELIWLLRGLVPGYRTIADFRKENRGALRAANRDFVLLARELDLLGGNLVAIDGAFFHGDASKASITTRQRLVEQLANLERSIETMPARWMRTTPKKRRNRSAAPRRPGKWPRSLRRCWPDAHTLRPICRGWRRAARRSCRAPTPTPGY